MARGSPDWKGKAPQKSLLQLLQEGNAFTAIAVIQGVALKWPIMQIYNPPDSGLDLYIRYADIYPEQWGGQFGIFGQIGLTKTNLDHGGNRKNFVPYGSAEVYSHVHDTFLTPIYGGAPCNADQFARIDNIDLWVQPGYYATFGYNTYNTTVLIMVCYYEFTHME